jgi:hypothetical protein
MNIFNITPSGYRFNKLLLFSLIFILTGIFIHNLFINGYEQHPYFKCNAPSGAMCRNPVATITPSCSLWCPPIKCPEWWCSQEFLPKGEYGIKPSFLQTNFSLIAWSSLILMFFINHFLYNRGVKFSIPTKRKLVPEWMAAIIKRINPKFENEVDFKAVDEKIIESDKND